MDWYDDYAIHVENIDRQHQELFQVVTRLQEALTAGAMHAEIAHALKFLVEYTRRHFHDEEELMEAIGFAELASHRQQHHKLIDDVRKILLDLKKGKAIHPYELIDFLTDWLINHIRHEDKKIGRAVARRHEEHPDWDGRFH
jgi:hemerythrin